MIKDTCLFSIGFVAFTFTILFFPVVAMYSVYAVGPWEILWASVMLAVVFLAMLKLFASKVLDHIVLAFMLVALAVYLRWEHLTRKEC